MTATNVSAETNTLETSLKETLDRVLNYAEKFFVTEEDLAVLESKLNDYDSLADLVDIIKEVFGSLTAKIDEKFEAIGHENYDELEKTVQKHESEIRNHIRIEQQMKLYTESIQSKLDDSEKAKIDVVEQSKTTVNSLKKDNQKLVESVKQKAEEIEKLNAKLRSLEELNQEYKTKLQEMPQMQERINYLEKRGKLSTPSTRKNSFQNGYDVENTRKLETDTDLSNPNSKLDKAKKSLKIMSSSQHTTPPKFVNKTLPNTSHVVSKNKDSLRVKLEISDTRYRKDLESLKQSYQRFYNPTKATSRERERERQRKSISKTKELKNIYSIPLVANSSNTSLIQSTQNQNLSHRDYTVQRLHHRSNSHGSRNKSGSSFTK